MKKKRLLFSMPWLLVAALFMPLVGCSSDDDEPELQKVIKTFTFDHFKQYGCYIVGNYSNEDLWCRNVWGNKGASFNVYMVQNGKIYDAGSVHSNDTIFTGEETKTKSLTFDVAIPTIINKERAFDVMAFCYVESSLSGGNIECKVDLKRNGSMPLWDNCQLSSMETDGKSYSLSTNESVNVHNTTSDTITVRHKGFEAKDKWYYSKANVVLTADRKVSASGSSTGEEDVSRAYKVAPGHYVTLWSFYVPTGKKMKDARLVLEINGKDVKTQPISSDVNIELGQYYRMTVRWDGKSLKWLLGNGETRGLKGKDMFSNADLISCGDPSTDF
jgi:hypothetical protein